MDARHTIVAELHAVGATVQQMSAELGITQRTLQLWLKRPDVRRLVSEIRAVGLSEVSGKLQARLSRAADRLEQIIADDNTDERTMLVAVKLHFDIVLKIRTFEEYDERLRQVEEKLGIGDRVLIP